MGALLKLAGATTTARWWEIRDSEFLAIGGFGFLAHDKASSICGAGLCRSGLPGLGAGFQSFRRHDRNRQHELRSLAIDARASTGGNHLDLRFLDGTELRRRSKRSNAGENQRGGDRGRSRKDMRSANVADLGQRCMDRLSWV